MPSHLSSIGFPVRTEEEFRALARRLLQASAPLTSPNGRYFRWSSECGAEVWLQVDGEDNLVGLAPHYSGPTRMRVRLERRIHRPKETLLDGAFHVWADPDPKDPESGAYPFVFDSPDFDRLGSVELPAVMEVQIAAFAHELEAYDTPEDFDKAQDGETPKFAAESFIPSGLFAFGEKEPGPPEALAVLSGRILDAESFTNPLTTQPFQWARVRTLGGKLDVVMDPALLKTPLKKDGVLHGSFWLSGRLIG